MTSNTLAESMLGKFAAITLDPDRWPAKHIAYRQVVAVDAYEEGAPMRELAIHFNRKIGIRSFSDLKSGIDVAMVSPSEEAGEFSGYLLSREGVRITVRILG